MPNVAPKALDKQRYQSIGPSRPSLRMQFSSCYLLHAFLLAVCLLWLHQVSTAAAVSCTTQATFQVGPSGCASAADAVALLLGNNNQIISANASFTGGCFAASHMGQMGLVTSFGPCHYLKDSFAAGGFPCLTPKKRLRTANPSCETVHFACTGFVHKIVAFTATQQCSTQVATALH